MWDCRPESLVSMRDSMASRPDSRESSSDWWARHAGCTRERSVSSSGSWANSWDSTVSSLDSLASSSVTLVSMPVRSVSRPARLDCSSDWLVSTLGSMASSQSHRRPDCSASTLTCTLAIDLRGRRHRHASTVREQSARRQSHR